MEIPKTLREFASADDYDPSSMPVAKARQHIRSFLTPVTAIECLHVSSAPGRSRQAPAHRRQVSGYVDRLFMGKGEVYRRGELDKNLPVPCDARVHLRLPRAAERHRVERFG
jgi:hypothetical protein